MGRNTNLKRSLIQCPFSKIMAVASSMGPIASPAMNGFFVLKFTGPSMHFLYGMGLKSYRVFKWINVVKDRAGEVVQPEKLLLPKSMT